MEGRWQRRQLKRVGFVALALLALTAPCAATAQTAGEYVDWLDQSPSPEFRAATVVTNLWLAAFAITSALFGILGAVVAVQWPNPRILCYKTSYSDMPSSSTRSCCSLYSLNLAFCVFWLLVFAIMVIARDVIRLVVCLCFCIVHTTVVVVFRLRFKRFGRPERAINAPDMGTSSSMTGGFSGLAGGPRPAVGIPIYNIPMQTVVIGGPAAAADQQAAAAAAGGGGAAAGAGSSSSYGWYDASCVPPHQQQPPSLFGNGAAQQPSAAAAVGPFVAYPPQPGSSYGMYGGTSPYPQPLPVAQQQQQQQPGATAAPAPVAAASAAAASPAVGLPLAGAAAGDAGVPAAAAPGQPARQ